MQASDMNLTVAAMPGWNVTTPWGASMRVVDLRSNPLTALLPMSCSDVIGGLTGLTQL
jgi:hypothetical protein